MQIAQITKRDVWHINELLRVVNEEVEARKLSEGIKVGEIKGLEYPLRQIVPPTVSALVVRDGNDNRKPQCVYCKAEHYSASCEAVRIQVKQGEEIKISVLSFPAICSPLQVPVEIDRYPHLQDLDLADVSSPPLNILQMLTC